MAIRSILVQLDLDGPVRPRIDFAAGLARRFDARLVGFAAGSLFPMASVVDGAVVETAIYQEQITEIEDRLKAIGETFAKAVEGIPDTNFRGLVGPPTMLLSLHARAADLVVAGSVTGQPPSRSVDPGDLILNAGRPVLLAPDDHKPLQARKILVAWKDSREARRAVRDALPFLGEAEEVMVVTLRAEDDRGPEQTSLADVAAYLGRHVARVRTDLVDPGAAGWGEVLAGLAVDSGADLVVAGAYGHSRLREWIFGGVTRELLKSGTLCRLFSC